VIETGLKKLRIDAVDEMHGIRKKYIRASSREIEEMAESVCGEIEKKHRS
jgi:hypothetical protein